MVATWLKVLDPWARMLPSVEKAPKSVRFTTKGLYTFLALIVYLTASQVPLYGLHASIRKDPCSGCAQYLQANEGASWSWV